MSAWSSSSLSFSDLNKNRNGSGLLPHTPKTRLSKQHLVEHKLFGSKRKNIQLGRTFRKKGKGIMKGSTSAHMHKEKGISPSLEEFDRMMNSISKGSSKSSKRFSFNRKQFG